MSESPDDTSDRLDWCMEALSQHQRQLFLFISALLPNPADVEEVLQETNIVIWNKFEQFDPDRPGSDFLAWAHRIAAFQARDYRRRQAKRGPVFSPDVMDQLATTAQRDQSVLELRRSALDMCMQRLPQSDLSFLEKCFAPGAKVASIAKQLNRSATSVYRSLRRIRKALAKCVERQMSQSD